jgi:ferredoxin
LFSDWNDQSQDSNAWSSSDDPEYQDQEDWQQLLARKEEGSFWSEFESSPETDEIVATQTPVSTEEEDADAWLDTLASLSAQEVEFNLKEADRADKVRQMEEWGFTPETISNTLDVAVDDKLEQDVEGMKLYRQESYEDDIDLTTVESHSRVEKDPETGEPIRSQMVYVDEHTCIGCTNCAMIAQSTFFMNDEHGRARVFDQWGDDDETIQIAIETCPVDCIHYVPYDELVKLEVERRDQNINFKARLVSQGEYSGLGLSHKVGGASAFTAPQQISGNSMPRCNNCPSRGCSNCPMYGVGKNPVFEEKEKMRQERLAKKRIQQERENQNKSADL